MAYVLQAVIGTHDAVVLASRAIHAPAVLLTPRLGMIPWTTDAFDALSPSDESAEPPGTRYCHSELAAILKTVSVDGPIIYAEAEIWAGQGEQGAVVFQDGEIVWTDPIGPIARHLRTPISAALRRLGVEPGPHDHDEFDAVGLGRHRETEDWLSEPHLPEP